MTINIIDLYNEWNEEETPSRELMKYISEKPMRLIDAYISNYKVFSDKVSIKFENNKRSILFVGVNASGKTTIAEAIAKTLSKINSAVYNKNIDNGDMIDNKNINEKNNYKSPALIEVNLGYENDKLVEIILAKSPSGSPKTINSALIQAKKLGKMYSYMLLEKDLDLPLYVYYGVDRSIFRTKERFNNTEIITNTSRLNAISQKLTTPLNFDALVLWLKYLDDSNNQDLANAFESMKSQLFNIEREVNSLSKYDDNIREGLGAADELLKKMSNITSLYSKLGENNEINDNNDVKIRQLNRIKELITYFIPEIKNIKIDRNLDYPFIAEKQNGSQFLLSELSQGEKSIFSLVCDLARRMFILNPHKENPLETHSIVIVDELELHLHPKWQTEIIPKLESTFINTKFILTTHTPTLVSSILNENLYLIGDNKVNSCKYESLGTYGAEYSRIYTEIYDLEHLRAKNDITKKLDEYLNLVNDSKYDSDRAIALKKELDRHFKGSEPALDEAELIIENKEWEKYLYEKSNKT